jgi:hypothetical protein
MAAALVIGATWIGTISLIADVVRKTLASVRQLTHRSNLKALQVECIRGEHRLLSLGDCR